MSPVDKEKGGRDIQQCLKVFIETAKHISGQLPNVRYKNPLRNLQICRRMLFPPVAASRMFLPCERQIVFCAPHKLCSGRQRERRRHFLPSSPPLLAQKSLDRLVFPLFFPQTFSPQKTALENVGQGIFSFPRKFSVPIFRENKLGERRWKKEKRRD